MSIILVPSMKIPKMTPRFKTCELHNELFCLLSHETKVNAVFYNHNDLQQVLGSSGTFGSFSFSFLTDKHASPLKVIKSTVVKGSTVHHWL